MSWDSGNVDFSSGGAQIDFSSGNAQMEWGNEGSSAPQTNEFGGNNFGGDSGNFGGDSNNYGGGQERSNEDRPPRRELTEEQMQHRSYKWASNRARYEYNENAVGDDGMAPRDEELENELFGAGNSDHTGLDFSKYKNIPVRVERGNAPSPIPNFDSADLHPVMKENIRLACYSVPTPVQTYSIPIVTTGKDLMACAQTGSGKTAAFLVPTLSSLFYNARELQKPRPAPYEYRTYKAEPLVLIIAPTRELCSQIFDECRKLTYRSSLRPCAVYGGADSIGQIRQLERGCDVLAAAPGRLMDFIQRGKISLARVKYLILDEADRMLDMGFEAIIRNIIEKNGMNADRQTLLFSATFPRAIRALARDFLKPDYLFLKVGRVGGTSSSITQNIMYVEEDEKREALRNLLNSQPPSRTLIFVETKRSADSLDHYLYERSFPSTSIHGDRTQMEREDALLAFKSGKCPILVATAVAARGIDIKNVMHVINYDMPQDMDEYIHRIGRTARVGKAGLATSFFNSRSDNLAPELTKLLLECKQTVPDFLQPYVTEDITFDEDLDDNDVQAPSYAGQEYVPMERNVPGAPQGYNNADGTGAADEAWDSGNKNTGRPGDWNCPSCGISNFASRYECFKCSTPKPEGAEGGDNSYGGGGYGNDDYSGGRQNNSRPGDWDCPECQQSNFASRYECFKCNAARPEGMGAPRREPRARREGDWDCPSCSAVNFASRSECFKCHAAKDGADNSYGADSYGADNNASGNFESGGNWDASAASGGWGGAAETTSAPAASGGWGGATEETTSAPAPQAGGWGGATETTTNQSSGGWGASEPVKSTPPPQQQAPAPQAGGWGASEPVQQSAGGWGAPEPVKATPPPQQQAPAPQAGGWGAPEPVKATPPPPQQQQQQAPVVNDGGWGSAPAVSGNDGWGSAPSNAGSGW